jgi:hypothetical protein
MDMPPVCPVAPGHAGRTARYPGTGRLAGLLLLEIRPASSEADLVSTSSLFCRSY